MLKKILSVILALSLCTTMLVVALVTSAPETVALGDDSSITLPIWDSDQFTGTTRGTVSIQNTVLQISAADTSSQLWAAKQDYKLAKVYDLSKAPLFKIDVFMPAGDYNADNYELRLSFGFEEYPNYGIDGGVWLTSLKNFKKGAWNTVWFDAKTANEIHPNNKAGFDPAVWDGVKELRVAIRKAKSAITTDLIAEGAAFRFRNLTFTNCELPIASPNANSASGVSAGTLGNFAGILGSAAADYSDGSMTMVGNGKNYNATNKWAMLTQANFLGKPLDFTGAKYLAVDFYMPEMTLEESYHYRFQLKIGSTDQGKAYSSKMTEEIDLSSLKQGAWNTLVFRRDTALTDEQMGRLGNFSFAICADAANANFKPTFKVRNFRIWKNKPILEATNPALQVGEDLLKADGTEQLQSVSKGTFSNEAPYSDYASGKGAFVAASGQSPIVKKHLQANLSEVNYLKVKMYIADYSKAGNILMELATVGDANGERMYRLHAGMLHNGWNTVILSLNEKYGASAADTIGYHDNAAENLGYDAKHIQYMRIFTSSTTTVAVGAITGYELPDVPADNLLSGFDGEIIKYYNPALDSTVSGGGVIEGTYRGNAVARAFSTARNLAGKVIVLNVYVPSATIPTWIAVELSSNGIHDKQEICFVLQKSENAFKAGWNQLILDPSRDARVTANTTANDGTFGYTTNTDTNGAFDKTKMNYMRVYANANTKIVNFGCITVRDAKEGALQVGGELLKADGTDSMTADTHGTFNNADPYNSYDSTKGAYVVNPGGSYKNIVKRNFQIDISALDYLKVKVYVTDYNKNGNILMELATVGDGKGERMYRLHDGAVHKGWNTVILSLNEKYGASAPDTIGYHDAPAENAGYDASDIRYLRITSNATATVGIGAITGYELPNVPADNLLSGFDGEIIKYYNPVLDSTVFGGDVIEGTYKGTQVSRVFSKARDLTDKVIVLNVYVPSATIPTWIAVELTSSGVHDKQEICFVLQKSENAFKAGWNRLVLDPSRDARVTSNAAANDGTFGYTLNSTTNGAFDKTKMNYMRLYTDNAAKIVNFGSVVVESIASTKLQVGGELLKADGTESMTADTHGVFNNAAPYNSYDSTKGAYVVTPGGSAKVIVKRNFRVDISALDYLKVKVYITDYKKNGNILMELATVGDGKGERMYRLHDGALHNGWNTVILSLNEKYGASAPDTVGYHDSPTENAGYDASNIRYLRIVTDSTATVGIGAITGYHMPSVPADHLLSGFDGEWIKYYNPTLDPTVIGGGVMEGTYKGTHVSRVFSKARDLNDKVIVLNVYVPSATIPDWIAVELSSNGVHDKQEVCFILKKSENAFKAGWNRLMLDPSRDARSIFDDEVSNGTFGYNSNTDTNGVFDISKMNYMRIYTNNAAKIVNFGAVTVQEHPGGSSSSSSSGSSSEPPIDLPDDKQYLIAVYNGEAMAQGSGHRLDTTLHGGEGIQGSYTSTTRISKKLATPINIKGKTVTVNFWVDATVMTTSDYLVFELTSSGKSDSREVAWTIQKNRLTHGWNQLVLDPNYIRQEAGPEAIGYTNFTSDGGPNLEALNYFRVYRGRGSFNFAVGAVYVTPEGGNQSGSSDTGKDDKTYLIQAQWGEMILQGTFDPKLNAYWDGKHGGYANNKGVCVRKQFAPMDLSNAKTLTFYFYVEKASDLDRVDIEITSSGTHDVEERLYRLGPGDVKDGWNVMYLDLHKTGVAAFNDGAMGYTGFGDGFDITAVDYVRVHAYSDSAFAVGAMYVTPGDFNTGADTGDNNHLFLVFGVLLLACAAAATAVFCGKKHFNNF